MSEETITQDAATEAAKKKAPGASLKVSEKGAVSVYGLGRFPVTLYKEQWRRLLAMSPEILAFIAANDEKLKTKPVAEKGASAPPAPPAPEAPPSE